MTSHLHEELGVYEGSLRVKQMAVLTGDYSFLKQLKELDMFFQGKDPLHQTMRRLARALDKARISYVVVDGMAVFAHRHRRATNDVDILLTADGFARFLERFVPMTYERVPRRARRFLDPANGTTIDILVTGRFPGSGKPGPVAYPDPADVAETIDKIRIIDLQNLIQLKLAARRHQEFADVVSLIRVHSLDESFRTRLHPSFHRDFIECLEEKRREDEYEARQDEEMDQ